METYVYQNITAAWGIVEFESEVIRLFLNLK